MQIACARVHVFVTPAQLTASEAHEVDGHALPVLAVDTVEPVRSHDLAVDCVCVGACLRCVAFVTWAACVFPSASSVVHSLHCACSDISFLHCRDARNMASASARSNARASRKR